MLNYRADPELLRPYVPAPAELDLFRGEAFFSLVGFRFLRTRIFGTPLFGMPVPFHANFDEVNLRIYVRRREGGTIRRGVVFIREIVPRRAVAAIARQVYNEPYVALPMRSSVELSPSGISAEYGWRFAGEWNRLHVRARGEPELPSPGSLEEFIVERQWGYTAQRNRSAIEYEVVHPRWRVWPAEEDAGFEGDAASLYGASFASIIGRAPDNALIADGSAVTVSRGAPVY